MTDFAAPLTVDGVPVGSLLSPGKVFYVDGSIGTNNLQSAGTAQKPFDTGAFALTACSANRGDTIVIGLGHDQTLATMFALNTKAGVRFIDLRNGAMWITQGVGSYFGPSVAFTAKRVAALLPATTNLTIFNVVGCVKITDLWGLVEVVIANTACQWKFTAVPTGLSGTDLCANGTDLAAAAVGTTLGITGVFATGGSIFANQTRVAQLNAQIVHTGIIRITTTGSPATGTVSYHCRYEPITPGSYIFAA